MGFWHKRTKLENCLIASTFLFLLLSIGLLIGLIVVKNQTEDSEASIDSEDSEDSDSFCETKECLIAAAELQKSMNLSADPCEDFYEYACGGWMKNNIIAPDRSRWSQFDVTRKTLADKVRVILEGEYNSSSTSIIGKTLNLYKKCMNLAKREIDGFDELKSRLNQIGWPMINNGQLGRIQDWTEVYAMLNKLFGFNFILSNYVYLDAKNTSIYSLYVDSPTFGVGRAQLIKPEDEQNKKIIEAYKQFIRSSVYLLGDNISPHLEDDINKMVQFEMELAKISADNVVRRNKTLLYGTKITIKEFEENYENIPLSNIEREVFINVLDGVVNESSGLIVYDRDYFENVGEILGRYNNDENRTIIFNYLSWRLVKSLGKYTNKAFRDIEFQYDKVVSGIEEPKPLWEDCVDTVNNRLLFAVGKLYIDENFSEEGKIDLNDNIDLLEEAFKQLLNGNEWMKEETKKEALNKLQKMLRAIAYPDFITTDKLETYYEELNLSDDMTYYHSIQLLSEWSNVKSLRRLANNVTLNRTELDWTTGPAVVNAFFSPNINRITFPAGILQSPFYTYGLPASLNLGAIGVVIGHEITHAFDDSGSQYDEVGNLHNWWDEETKAEFNKKVQCFIEQYSNYTDPLAGKPINGSTTIGENIADNGGLRQAYRALQNYKGSKQLLPASMKTFTSEQLFFLSFANVWCTNIRREALINQIETDPHSPGKYRVWGSVSNSEGFAKAFNCKEGSNMSRDSKCILW